MAQQPFGNKSTIKKLDTVTDYLAFYTRALSGKFNLNYFDAFAGTGEIPHGDSLPLFEGMVELATVIEGSARRSLKIPVPFDRYFFSDSKRSYVIALSKLRDEFPKLATRINILHGDANDLVKKYCHSELTRKDRTVFFLDPYGNQVHWSTVETIAQTEGSDLWYLFPSGLGVVRQMSYNAAVRKEAEDSLNLLFGDNSWFEAFTAPSDQLNWIDQVDENRHKIATADAVTRFMIGKMKTVFKGVVLDQWLPLGKKGGHWYSLIFACSNESPTARNLASRVAKGIMRRK